MSSGQAPDAMSRDSYLARNEFGSDDSGHLSQFVNEDVLDPTHPLNLLIPKTPYRPPSWVEAPVVPIDPQPENIVPEVPPAVAYSPAWQDHVPKAYNAIDVPKRISSKPRMIGSNRSSLSYGGDLTLDIRSEDDLGKSQPWTTKTNKDRHPQGVVQTPRGSVKRRTANSQDLAKSSDSFVSAGFSPNAAGIRRGSILQTPGSYYRRQKSLSEGLQQPQIIFPSHELKAGEKSVSPPTEAEVPNNTPRTASRLSDRSVGSAGSASKRAQRVATDHFNDFSMHGKSKTVSPQGSSVESPRSQLSGILDLYLALPRPPSIVAEGKEQSQPDKSQELDFSAKKEKLRCTSEPLSSANESEHSGDSEVVPGPQFLGAQSPTSKWMYTRNSSRSTGIFETVNLDLVSPSRRDARADSVESSAHRLRKWLTKRLSLASVLERDHLDARTQHKQAHQLPTEDPRWGPYADGNNERTPQQSVSNGKQGERKIQDLERMLHKALTFAHRAAGTNDQRAAELEQDEISEALSSRGRHSTDPGPVHRKSSDLSNFLSEYHRTLSWFSDRNKSSPRPKAGPFPEDTDETTQKPGDMRGHSGEGSLIAQDGSSRGNPSRFSMLPLRNLELPSLQRSATEYAPPVVPRSETASIQSQIPGAYPHCTPSNDVSWPSSVVRDFAYRSGPKSPPLSSRKGSRQIAIEEHKPIEERERYPEPNFVPHISIDDQIEAQPAHSMEQGQSATSLAVQSMRESVRRNEKPDVQPRLSSSMFRSRSAKRYTRAPEQIPQASGVEMEPRSEIEDGLYIVEFPHGAVSGFSGNFEDTPRDYAEVSNRGYTKVPWMTAPAGSQYPMYPDRQNYSGDPDFEAAQLRGEAEEKYEMREFQQGRRRHHSFRGKVRASLHRAHRRGMLARDWGNGKKRFAATVACTSTALIGLIVGIYAGQVPAIQYAIVDEITHWAVLGNVFFYLGLAITTILAWPLPLLYGRKRLTLASLAILLPLQFPQAIVCMQQRDPSTSVYRVGLLLPRFASGIVAGFANMNFLPILLDLYGSSLQSSTPHQELVDENDPRRHGGGMGIWLSIWTWCHIGSIGVGFLIGAVIIGFLNVAWGFWIVIFATLATILLNVIAPETRRSAFRRSMAEVRRGTDVSRRVGRGEIMMHLYATGPLHWWEELRAGFVLNFRMLKQSGFTIMALYQGWIYGQVVMVMILLGALASRYYQYQPQYVALCVAAFPLGAVIAVPFQKASFFSRARTHGQRTDSMTFVKRVSWTSHLVRRAIFMTLLPLVALAYTFLSYGPPVPMALPVVFAAAIGFLTNLALSECYGLIMETFDTSDLQPGMTGRPRKELPEDILKRRTNFSCFPRVTAGFAIVQTVSFCIAAAATGVGGNVERAHGVEAATGIVAGVLLGLTLLLMAVLTRFRTVQVVPTNRVGTAELSGPGDDLPVVIGHPSGTTRRISLLELGNLTRWTEIRRRNKLMGGGRHGKYP